MARVEPVMPMTRARQLTDQDLVDGTLGETANAAADDEVTQTQTHTLWLARSLSLSLSLCLSLSRHLYSSLQEPVRKKKKDYPKPDEAVEAEKLHRTIFVGGLPVTNKHRKIAKHFSKYGAVESVRIRSVAYATQVRCASLLFHVSIAVL